MKKKIFSNSSYPLRKLMATITSLGILSLFLISGGCGKKIYTPPDNKVKSRIILINGIYAPGFYVELDGEDAGFLQQEREIRVKPGDHKLKLFNQESSYSLLKEMQETTTHQFNLQVTVGEGEAKEIILSWEDKGYSKGTGQKLLLPSEEERKKEEMKRERARHDTSPTRPY